MFPSGEDSHTTNYIHPVSYLNAATIVNRHESTVSSNGDTTTPPHSQGESPNSTGTFTDASSLDSPDQIKVELSEVCDLNSVVKRESSEESQTTQTSKKIDSDGPYTCRWKDCILEFDDPKVLYQHLCDHHVGRKCNKNLTLDCQWDGCGVSTVKRDHITSHLRVHVPLKPFLCNFCTKRFKRPQDLKKHIKIHADGSVDNDKQLLQAAQSVRLANPYGQLDHVYDLPLPTMYPSLSQEQLQLQQQQQMLHRQEERKRKPDSHFSIPSLYEDLKRAKLQPHYNNELASRLNNLDNYFGLSSPDLHMGSQTKYGGFNSQQDLIEASSFFNQLSGSMDTLSRPPPLYSPSAFFPQQQQSTPQFAFNGNYSSGSLYPPVQGSSTSSYFPQVGYRVDNGDFTKKFNVSMGQKAGVSAQKDGVPADLVSQLENLSVDDKDDLEDDESGAVFTSHLMAIDVIKEFLESCVDKLRGQTDSHQPIERKSLYPRIISV
ncbi:unnamed protein product [Kuraishia capsulata CBS 1993]|uniref:C2H2-type domain-containing protein n=1 Tax=Kuraishia capsulata CBS 1993 TaxID=1382522 RepID=W6MF14_9ASCO|nr:uncharacterized protein KUCA_T00000054001 [Kuraishia capsulata CBS 1993]CDK24094.1 unnamed protein product [Kuraishia capsulata CBS 1993]